MSIRLFRRPAFLGTALVFGIVSMTRAESYYFQDLGTLGGRKSAATAINNAGQVVGIADITNSLYSHAVLFSGTGSNNIDLDLPGRVDYVGEAHGINDFGEIVGWSYTATGRYQPTVFGPAGKTILRDLCDAELTSGECQAINNAGTIIGWADDCNYNYKSCNFSGANTNETDLGSIGGGVSSAAYGINSYGLVVGLGNRKDGYGHAAAFGTGGNLDLGVLGGNSSRAFGINDSNAIVGDSTIAGNSAFHAVLFSNTGISNFDLGTLGGYSSHAYAINNLGEIVGNSQTTTNDDSYHGFIYHNGVMKDLNNLVLPGSGISNIRFLYEGGDLPGRCINDLGQIAAEGEVNGPTHAILLTPVLRRLGVAIQGTNVIIKFDAVVGKTYRLEETADFAHPNWQGLPGLPDYIATNTGPAQIAYFGGLNLSKAFYRVQLIY